jgi:3-deoxy-D-manno-octulosonate 8-phosphate phosphatase (KDO 8-P phosphatase)
MASRVPSIRLIVFDFDGVLTDNRVLVCENGLESVFCSRADGLGFDAMQRAGLPVLIMSTETNPVVGKRAAKLRVHVLQSVADKGIAISEHCAKAGIPLARTAFVGNDVNDLPAMKIVGYPIAVADAHVRVKALAWRVLRARGGEGAAREVAERILKLL